MVDNSCIRIIVYDTISTALLFGYLLSILLIDVTYTFIGRVKIYFVLIGIFLHIFSGVTLWSNNARGNLLKWLTNNRQRNKGCMVYSFFT